MNSAELFSLKDKKVLFVGGAGYLASPIVDCIAADGAKLVIADFNEENANKKAKELSDKYKTDITGIKLDAGNIDSIAEAFKTVKEKLSGLDVLVSGISGPCVPDFDKLTADEMNRHFSTHVTGNFIIAREAEKLMNDGGSMVIFSSMYGEVSPDPRVYIPPMQPNPVEYGVAKSAINQLVRYLAVKWGNKNIRVNGVAPGPFPNAANYNGEEDFIERLNQKTPMGRVGRQDEMTGSVIFLASNASSYVTGQIVSVNGGWNIW